MQIFEYLDPNFSDFFMDVKYTSKLEDDLDLIEEGDKTFLNVVEGVYEMLQDHVKDAGVPEKKEAIATGKKCTVCKEGEIVQKSGRFGDFFSCNNYPEVNSSRRFQAVTGC